MFINVFISQIPITTAGNGARVLGKTIDKQRLMTISQSRIFALLAVGKKKRNLLTL